MIMQNTIFSILITDTQQVLMTIRTPVQVSLPPRVFTDKSQRPSKEMLVHN